MDIRHLTPTYAVSPQIAPQDVAEVRARGFATVICNRPDGEIPLPLQAAELRTLVEAAGMAFVLNPVLPGAMTDANITTQGQAIAGSDGPVFAYCASGNRSSIVWALSQAGTTPTGDLIAAAARFGYQLEPYRAMIDARGAAKADT